MQDAECTIQTLPERMHTSPPSENDLLRSAQRGDDRAFKALYDLFAPKMYRLAFRFHGNTNDAEDAIQEAFVNAYRHLGEFRGGSQVGTWFYRITVNTCISMKRKRRLRLVEPEAYDPGAIPSSTAPADSVLSDILHREILLLEGKRRMAFLLFAVEGFTHAEIADCLGIAENTSKSLYRRARHKLIQRLKRYGITEEELNE